MITIEAQLQRLKLPQLQWIWHEDDYTRTLPQSEQQKRFKAGAKEALTAIHLHIGALEEHTSDVLAKVGCFYVISPWCDESMKLMAREIIDSLAIDQDQWLSVRTIITEDLKLLKSEKVSKAGYKKLSNAHRGLKPSLGFQQDRRDEWKEKYIRSVPLFALWLHQLDAKGIRENWWLISPTILNVLDDHEAPIKLEGVEMLSILMGAVEPSFLEMTGVLQIFYDAVKPLLSYLPSFTPTDLSVEVLQRTYPALIKLFGKSPNTKRLLLDLLNTGLLSSLDQVRDNFAALRVLMQHCRVIIGLLEDSTLLVLPRLIFSVGSLLANPFIDADQLLLKDTLECLIQLELNCWMRLEQHKYDIAAMCVMAASKATTKTTKSKAAAALKVLRGCTAFTDEECEMLFPEAETPTETPTETHTHSAHAQ